MAAVRTRLRPIESCCGPISFLLRALGCGLEIRPVEQKGKKDVAAEGDLRVAAVILCVSLNSEELFAFVKMTQALRAVEVYQSSFTWRIDAQSAQ